MLPAKTPLWGKRFSENKIGYGISQLASGLAIRYQLEGANGEEEKAATMKPSASLQQVASIWPKAGPNKKFR
jgi:hypothetical protein